MVPSGGQAGERGALATADGDEALPLGLLPGSWGGGLDRWRPSWMGGHPGFACWIRREAWCRTLHILNA